VAAADVWREATAIVAAMSGSILGAAVKRSEDPRFMFHRQDQSAMSLAIQPFGLNLAKYDELVTYKYLNPEGATFVNNGM